MTDPNQNRPIQWPGVLLIWGFFMFVLFVIWTIKGVLPWQ